jgi:hypothetical protein
MIRSIHSELNQPVFSSSTPAHEHDLIRTSLRDSTTAQNIDVLKCLTCDVAYCTLCGRPLQHQDCSYSGFINLFCDGLFVD